MTFVHKFSDGNICTLKIGEGKAKAIWKTMPEWETIQQEYLIWRNKVVEMYLNEKTY